MSRRLQLCGCSLVLSGKEFIVIHLHHPFIFLIFSTDPSICFPVKLYQLQQVLTAVCLGGVVWQSDLNMLCCREAMPCNSTLNLPFQHNVTTCLILGSTTAFLMFSLILNRVKMYDNVCMLKVEMCPPVSIIPVPEPCTSEGLAVLCGVTSNLSRNVTKKKWLFERQQENISYQHLLLYSPPWIQNVVTRRHQDEAVSYLTLCWWGTAGLTLF